MNPRPLRAGVFIKDMFGDLKILNLSTEVLKLRRASALCLPRAYGVCSLRHKEDHNMSNILKILLVEDNKHDAALIKEMIYEDVIKDADDVHYDLVHRKTCKDALNYLAENKVDVILLDLSLPDSSGLDTVKKIVEQEKNTPSLF